MTTQTTQTDPTLNQEEQSILKAFESGKLVSRKDPKQLKQFKKAAENTFKKSATISIRLAPREVDALKIKAQRSGLKYQTLMALLARQYLKGEISISI